MEGRERKGRMVEGGRRKEEEGGKRKERGEINRYWLCRNGGRFKTREKLGFVYPRRGREGKKLRDISPGAFSSEIKNRFDCYLLRLT